MVRYENKVTPLISRAAFRRRVAAHGGLALSVIAASLAIGVIGYHLLAGLSWLDALLNASMILGGMGPVDKVETPSAKIFASAYALYSGLVLLVSVGILYAPIVHRFMHRFHLEAGAAKD